MLARTQGKPASLIGSGVLALTCGIGNVRRRARVSSSPRRQRAIRRRATSGAAVPSTMARDDKAYVTVRKSPSLLPRRLSGWQHRELGTPRK